MSAGTPVVLVHGALQSRMGLVPTAQWLKARGFQPHAFGYPSRRGRLEDHGDRLATWLDARLDGVRVPVLGFLTHSMGGLVVRAYLSRHAGRHADVQRVVMLSPPNRGSELARSFAGWRLARWLYGDALGELLPERVAELGDVPGSAQVLVLAGARGHERGYNPRIPGDNDGLVAVAEMGLPRVEPTIVGGAHSWLQWRPAVLARASAFLSGQ